MTLVMAYVILLSAAVASVAAAGDAASRSRRLPRRWTWLAALASLAPITAFVMVVPRPAPAIDAESLSAAAAGAVSSGAATAVAMPEPGVAFLPVMDRLATAGWLVTTVALLGALGLGQWRIARARRHARRATVQGRDVLITHDLGPAVAGIARPVVLVPRWVSALDDTSQRLLLAHEFEHVRQRDTTLLMAGALMTALLPWNPVAWWLSRRLRIAVEMDCDGRVLAAHPTVRPYADLLLLAASRNRLTTRLLAAHFGEYTSDLERRIRAMTETRWPRRPLVGAAMTGGALIALSCEVPRPDPVAPPASVPAGAASGVRGAGEVDTPVTVAAGSRFPVYPDILRQAGVQGVVEVSFVVDEQGVPDAGSLAILHSTHELFSVAVRQAVPAMRFVPAVADGRTVAMRVVQPFTFSIVGAGEAPKAPLMQGGDDRASGVVINGISSQKRLAYTVDRRDEPRAVVRRPGDAAEEPYIIVRSRSGTELRRYDPTSRSARNPLADLQPADIESIEVLKGPQACGPSFPCPAIVVTVKAGREAGYR